MQLDKKEKGFSFNKEGPLDMRMDPHSPLTAKEIVNQWSEEKLGEIFREFGEEPKWRKAARIIAEARREKVIETTKELADLLARAIGRGFKKSLHPATLVFQALRICVNGELEAIKQALSKAISLLNIGGRIGVLSFHSLEDGIVKSIFGQAAFVPARNKYREEVKNPILKLVTKKPELPTYEEVKKNRRSRSAKLRFAEKVGGND